jgi:L-rhamnose mutarotase
VRRNFPYGEIKGSRGLADYIDSIFFDNERTLVATFKYVGDDYEADMEKMRANPKVREWWAMTDGMQVCWFS